MADWLDSRLAGLRLLGAFDPQDLLCIPIPWTDIELCLGLNVLGIFVALAGVLTASSVAYRRWGFTNRGPGPGMKPLICTGQYGDQRHEPAERVYEGAVAQCPVCGHALDDSPY